MPVGAERAGKFDLSVGRGDHLGLGAGCHGQSPELTAQAVILAKTLQDLPLDRIFKAALDARKCHGGPQEELLLALAFSFKGQGLPGFLCFLLQPGCSQVSNQLLQGLGSLGEFGSRAFFRQPAFRNCQKPAASSGR